MIGSFLVLWDGGEWCGIVYVHGGEVNCKFLREDGWGGYEVWTQEARRIPNENAKGSVNIASSLDCCSNMSTSVCRNTNQDYGRKNLIPTLNMSIPHILITNSNGMGISISSMG